MADTEDGTTKACGPSSPWILPALMFAVLGIALIAEPSTRLGVLVAALIPLAMVARILMKKS